jgi:UDP-N-acetyl-D-mannosaminuronate dehydrogenase
MRIGIIGLGYVGLPLAVEFCDAGHDVIGLDSVDFRGVTRGIEARNLVRL